MKIVSTKFCDSIDTDEKLVNRKISKDEQDDRRLNRSERHCFSVWWIAFKKGELFRNRAILSDGDSRKKRSNRRKLIYLVQPFLRGGKRSTTRERIWVSSRRRFTRKLLSLGGRRVEIRKVDLELVDSPRKVKFRISRAPLTKFRRTNSPRDQRPRPHTGTSHSQTRVAKLHRDRVSMTKKSARSDTRSRSDTEITIYCSFLW